MEKFSTSAVKGKTMASYINTGDMLLLDGKVHAVATSKDYTELYYDLEAREMMAHGLDYGVARGVVEIVVPDSGQRLKVELRRIAKVETERPNV